MMVLFQKFKRHLSFHHKFSYFWNVNIFTLWTFHILSSTSFEQPWMHLLCKLIFMPFWPCPKGALFPWPRKLFQATIWFYVTPITYKNNNIAMSNAIFPFYPIVPIMTISFQKWASYVPQPQWCSYLVNVHHFLLPSFHLLVPNSFEQYLGYFLYNANFMHFIHFQRNT